MRTKNSQKIILAAAALVALAILAFALRGGGVVPLRVGKGGMVGVATADGAIYFGELVLADSKSVVLRNVFTSVGYQTPPYDPEAGGPTPSPSYWVAPAGAVGGGTGAGAGVTGEDTTTVVPRSRVLFMSSDLAGFAAQAVRTWKPTPSPTPPPTPEPTRTPLPGEEGEVEVEVATPEPTPTPTLPPTPEPTEEPTPVPTLRPRI